MSQNLNKAEITVIISNNYKNDDGSIREAVRKPSDKLTVVQTYIPGRKRSDGEWGPSASLTVKVTSKTEIADGVKLEPKAKINVYGFFDPEEYVDKKTNTKRTYFVLVANKIEANSTNQNTGAGEQTTAADTTAPEIPATAASNSVPNANSSTPMPEDEDLPFL